MTDALYSAYPNVSFDASYANYLAYLGFSNKLAAESTSLATELPKWVKNPTELSVLDIGAGTGRLAQTVLDLYGSSTSRFSMTLLEPAVSAAQDMHAQFAADKRIEVHQTSFQSFLESGQKRQFSLVLAADVAYYFRDRDKFFRALLSLVAPGGVLCCIVGSISLFHHSLYRELLQAILLDPSVERSFGLDGYGACAEELELIAFNEGYIFDSTDVPANLLFTPEQIQQGANALQNKAECFSNRFCISLGFLFRIPISVIFAKRELVLEYLKTNDAYNCGIDIPCSEKLLFLRGR